MKVLAHLDPVVLERALLDELAETCPRAEPHAALVIVPNSRLAGHVERHDETIGSEARRVSQKQGGI